MSYRTLFRIPNPFWTKSSLISVVFKSGRHVGLGGIESHWLLEVRLGAGAGFPYGRSFYLAHDLYSRPLWGNHKDHIHWQFGGGEMVDGHWHAAQGARLPWQVGYSKHIIPQVDSGG